MRTTLLYYLSPSTVIWCWPLFVLARCGEQSATEGKPDEDHCDTLSAIKSAFMNVYFLVGVLPVPVIAMMMLAYTMGNIVEGYEDESGFHKK